MAPKGYKANDGQEGSKCTVLCTVNLRVPTGGKNQPDGWLDSILWFIRNLSLLKRYRDPKGPYVALTSKSTSREGTHCPSPNFFVS